MAGTLSRGDLRADLKASLHDAHAMLADPADFDRCLAVAVEELGRWLPRTLAANLTLVADQAEYPAPAEFKSFKMALWGRSTTIQPWDKNYPGKLPKVHHAEDLLILVPAPCAQQIAILGASYRYFYFAGYSIADDAAQTTVSADLRDLLLLRAQAECCKELALRNIGKPVQLRDGTNTVTRNGTPSYLYNQLMAEFLARCGQ